ncbi:MAG: methionine adenosyltransferase domain-containing protein, partial [Planctomycetota bacterium]|nr:methionine adenosyltransferase domain-containing protein [Planctomycetota bacterium]
PLSVRVDTFGTGKVDEVALEAAVNDAFDLRPSAIIGDLGLKAAIYRATSFHGHFGRDGFPWEATDRVAALKDALGAPAAG